MTYSRSASPKTPPSLNRIKVIVATGCGATTTKAILIDCVDGHYRQSSHA